MAESIQDVFKLYYRDVYSYLYSLCRDAFLAEDLACETFLEAVRSFVTFRGDSDVKTWLFTIARRRWFAHLRRAKRAPPADALDALAERLESGAAGTEERCERGALAGRVRALLDGEPARTRGIVLMRAEGYSFYEIGRKFGVSENSARVIDFRAREKIRAALKREGLWDE